MAFALYCSSHGLARLVQVICETALFLNDISLSQFRHQTRKSKDEVTGHESTHQWEWEDQVFALENLLDRGDSDRRRASRGP
jgi:hypothetical protein